jgi:hypothetical protein
MNIGDVIKGIGEAAYDVAVDKTLLEAGQDVTVPVDIQIATDQGKPIYLIFHLSTTKPV